MKRKNVFLNSCLHHSLNMYFLLHSIKQMSYSYRVVLEFKDKQKALKSDYLQY